MRHGAREHNYQAAARQTAAHIRAGIPLDAGSLELIRQHADVADTARALALLAAQADTTEAAPLLALVFSPGVQSRLELEPALAEADLDAEGAQELACAVARLVDEGGGAAVLTPQGARLALPFVEGGVEDFVRRLRPAATPPADLRRLLALRQDPAPASSTELAVLLRHSRLAWSPARLFFMATLLERAGPGPHICGLIGWAAGFLDLTGEDFDPRRALTMRRRALSLELRQAEAQEQTLARGSFEVRLSQGLRPGHAHAPDVRAALACLDRCARLVLGIAGEDLEAVQVRDLGEAQDPAALWRLFEPGG